MIYPNKIVSELSSQYHDRISQLQEKIREQQKEILKLQEMIEIITYSKEYDC